MKLKEYQLQAKRTCPSLGDIKLDLCHMVLGMNSELSELSDASIKQDKVNIGEELADIMWYVANYCTFRNLDLSNLKWNNNSIAQQPLDWFIQELTDLVKKYIAYNKEIHLIKEENLLCFIYNKIKTTDPSVDFMDKILQNNINKLKVRYPDKFTEENAINRNLEAERKELEK